MRLFALLSTAATLALALSAAASAPTQTPPGKGEGCHAGGAAPAASAKGEETPGLLTHLGSSGYAAEGVSDAARPYFEQGVRLFHTFDAPNAIRSFKEAQRAPARLRDVLLGRGLGARPDDQLPRRRQGARAWPASAALKAQSLQTGLSDKARRLIAAQVARYPRHAAQRRRRQRRPDLRRHHGAACRSASRTTTPWWSRPPPPS